MRLNPILTTRTYALTALSLSNFVRTIVSIDSNYVDAYNNLGVVQGKRIQKYIFQ